MGLWDSVKKYGGYALGGIPGMVGQFGGNPFEWGKNPVDPANAQIQDSDRMREFMWQQLGGIGGRQAPQVQGAMIANGPQSQVRGREMTLADQLAAVSTGQQAGAGELAVRRQGAQALAGLQSGARMARGGAAPVAARAAARAAGDLGVNLAGQAGIAGMQDQTQARGMLAGLLGQVRGQDVNVAGQNAQLQQQANLANQAAYLQQLGLNDSQIAQLLGQMGNLGAAEMQGRVGILSGNAAQTGILPDLLQMGGALGSAAIMSDRRVKKEIRDGSDEVDSFLDALMPQSFRYKSERHGKGRWSGVMAQDAERSSVGRDLVVETPDGKGLDGGKTLSTLLASVARLNKRLRDVEGK